MDGSLVQDDGIDLIVEELERCWEVTQDQDKASKIEKALFETQRDVKMETTFMSYVARRKLNFQQLENALGTSLPAVINGHSILRDAKLAENSNDKMVMWTGGSYDNDDVVRALVRLDRPEMPPGKSGRSGKTVPTYFTDPEVGASTIVPGSEIWTQPKVDRPHWNEILDALQEDADFCEDGETTIARDGAIAIPVVFFITDDSQEAIDYQTRYHRKNAGSTSFPTPWVPGYPRRSQCCADQGGFFCTGLASVPKEIEDNATTKGTIDVR